MSQIVEKKFPCAMLLGGLSVNLNHLKKEVQASTRAYDPFFDKPEIWPTSISLV